MSELIDLQRRFRELGRLRMGKMETIKGKPRPVKLQHWRLTSHSRVLLEAAAVVFGGTVQEWANAPTEGENYELLTETKTLPIIVPPGKVLSQDYELWSGGGCKRRCKGPNEERTSRQLLRDVPCSCPLDISERMELAQKGKACSPTTRLQVILPDVPDIGVWRIESHGYNAATELAGTYDLCRMSTEQGVPIRARLTIQPRSSKKEGKPRRDYIVPIIEIDELATDVIESIGIAALPAAERRALPQSQPAMTADKSAAAPGSAQFPPHAAIETQAVTPGQGDLPQWILDIDADDGTIIDAANYVAADATPEGADPPIMNSLHDVARLAISPEAQEAITRRIAGETPPDVEDPEQGQLS